MYFLLYNTLLLFFLNKYFFTRSRLLQTSTRQTVRAPNRRYLIREARSFRCFCTKAKKSEHGHLDASLCENVSQAQTVQNVHSMESKNEYRECLEAKEYDPLRGIMEEAGKTKDDEEIDKRALLELEIELMRQDSIDVPEVITPSNWEELVALPSRSARRKYLKFLFKNEKKRESVKKKKMLRHQERERERELSDLPEKSIMAEDGHFKYGLWGNSIFLRIREGSMNHFYNGRVMSALMHGQPLVIDVGFDEHMNIKESKNCASQLMVSIIA